MSVMSRFVLATKPSGISASKQFVDATGITDVEVQTLDIIVTDADDRFPEDVDVGADDAMVFEVPAKLVAALAKSTKAKLRPVATKWAKTEELAGSDVDVLVELLGKVVSLAKQAITKKLRMFLRVEG